MLVRLLPAVLLLLGCRGASPPAPAPARTADLAPAPPPAPRPRPPHAPMSQEELPTTSGSIAVGNLEAQVQSAERLVKDRPQDPMLLERLAVLLFTRGQYLGRIADYERAAELADRMARLAPKEPRSHLARARARSTFHRFPEALADLDRAAQLGEAGPRLDGSRAAILAALGRGDEALAIQERLAAARPDLLNLGAEAALRGELGDTERAEALFIKAQRLGPDVSPLPLAWLYLQQGLMWEAEGRTGRARELFLAARDRLPAYAAATAHLAAALAATGDRPQAVALLRPLCEASDDPEYPGQLAALLREAGQREEADALTQRARARYEELLRRHPEAFLAHAARFYLGAGGDPARAAQLAARNLALLPQSAEAHALAIDAALASGSAPRACALADAALKLPRKVPVGARLRVTAARALSQCGQGERAAQLLREASAGN